MDEKIRNYNLKRIMKLQDEITALREKNTTLTDEMLLLSNNSEKSY